MKFQVFDFEAYHWNKLYAIGVYDGINFEYVADNNKDNYFFVEWLLNHLKSDVVAYAHNGGKYDFIFIMQYLEHKNLKPYGLKVINGSIAEFRIEYNKKRYIFRDSYLILPQKLKDLTIDFDVKHKKLEMDYDIGIKDKMFKDYFRNDILGLYEVLELSNLTNHITIGSNAISNFKNIFYTDKMTSNEYGIEQLFRNGYYGGRTEIFKLIGKNINYYDINSLYPSVMYDFEYPLPIENNFKKVDKFNKDKLGIYYIKAGINDLNMPLLPYRNKGKLLFPIGNFKGYYYTPEINKAIELGYDIKVYNGYEFIKTDFIFKKYVDYYYGIKRDSIGSKKAIAKLMLNSLYGKFGQKRIQENYKFLEDGSLSNLNFRVTKYFDSNTEFIHPEIAAIVTSYARVRLYNLFERAGLEHIYYCDTDSIFTDAELNTSNNLGDIKLEDKVKEFRAINPKFYAYISSKDKLKIKCKGFSNKKFTLNDFNDAILNKDLSKFKDLKERISTFKERYKRNNVNNFADLIKISKNLRGFYDKRNVLNDGFSTKPLKIEDI